MIKIQLGTSHYLAGVGGGRAGANKGRVTDFYAGKMGHINLHKHMHT